MGYVFFITDAISDDRGLARRGEHGTQVVLDAIESGPLPSRHTLTGLRCHSDGGQFHLGRTTGERLAELGAIPSIGTVGDSYE